MTPRLCASSTLSTEHLWASSHVTWQQELGRQSVENRAVVNISYAHTKRQILREVWTIRRSARDNRSGKYCSFESFARANNKKWFCKLALTSSRDKTEQKNRHETSLLKTFVRCNKLPLVTSSLLNLFQFP